MTFSSHGKSHIHSLLWLTMSIRAYQDQNLHSADDFYIFIFIWIFKVDNRCNQSRWSSKNQFMDVMHMISSIMKSQNFKKCNFWFFSGQKSDLPPSPGRNQKIQILPKTSLFLDTLRSDFSPNIILIPFQHCGRKWHDELLEHVQNLLSSYAAINLERVFPNRRIGWNSTYDVCRHL